MPVRHLRGWQWLYLVYAACIVIFHYVLLRSRFPGPSTPTIVLFLALPLIVPGAILGVILDPDLMHPARPPGVRWILLAVNLLAYLAAPFLVARVIRWWKRWNTPWTQRQ